MDTRLGNLQDLQNILKEIDYLESVMKSIPKYENESPNIKRKPLARKHARTIIKLKPFDITLPNPGMLDELSLQQAILQQQNALLHQAESQNPQSASLLQIILDNNAKMILSLESQKQAYQATFSTTIEEQVADLKKENIAIEKIMEYNDIINNDPFKQHIQQLGLREYFPKLSHLIKDLKSGEIRANRSLMRDTVDTVFKNIEASKSHINNEIQKVQNEIKKNNGGIISSRSLIFSSSGKGAGEKQKKKTKKISCKT